MPHDDLIARLRKGIEDNISENQSEVETHPNDPSHVLYCPKRDDIAAVLTLLTPTGPWTGEKLRHAIVDALNCASDVLPVSEQIEQAYNTVADAINVALDSARPAAGKSAGNERPRKRSQASPPSARKAT